MLVQHVDTNNITASKRVRLISIDSVVPRLDGLLVSVVSFKHSTSTNNGMRENNRSTANVILVKLVRDINFGKTPTGHECFRKKEALDTNWTGMGFYV